MMSCVVIKALILGFSFVAVSAASTNVSKVPKTSTVKGVEATATRCNTVINNYHSGSSDDIKTVLSALQAVQNQLSEVQEDIRELKAAKGNKTGKSKIPFHTALFRGGKYLHQSEDRIPLSAVISKRACCTPVLK